MERLMAAPHKAVQQVREAMETTPGATTPDSALSVSSFLPENEVSAFCLERIYIVARSVVVVGILIVGYKPHIHE